MSKIERITLGSGDLYIAPFVAGTAPTVETVKVDANFLGYISGGATLEYKPSYYTAKDDSGKVTKTILTDEEVTLKSGILTFNATTLKKMTDTARITETTTLRTLKIGGVSNQTGAKYAILFHHADEVDGDIDVLIVGNNQAGFSLAFAKDKETVIDAEFKAAAMDSEGTLILYSEEIVGGQA